MRVRRVGPTSIGRGLLRSGLFGVAVLAVPTILVGGAPPSASALSLLGGPFPASMPLGGLEATGSPLTGDVAARHAINPGDSADLRSDARRAQRRFERTRVNHSDWSLGAVTGTRCDEHVGRFCLRHGRGVPWEPPEEPEALRDARHELLDELARVGAGIPGDDWVLGQRVRYLGEAGRWDEAEGVARDCEGSRWWCQALLGYLLHERGAFVEAADAFGEALEAMGEDSAARWTDPEMLADPDGSSLLADAEGEERRRLEERFWMLSNPLFLADGNDRWTGHLMRQVASTMREDARNPHGMVWRDDLAEITVRYGRTIGWQRDRRPVGQLGPQPVLGRRDPRSRGFVPAGEHLADPAAIPEGAWTTDDPATAEQYAPPYAPRIEGLDPQVAAFPRGDSLAVVAAWELSDWVEYEGADPEAPPEGPFEAGLFLVPLDAGEAQNGAGEAGEGDPRTSSQGLSPWARGEVRHSARVEAAGQRDALRLDVPWDDHVISLEVLDEDEAKGWRARHGLTLERPSGPGPVVSETLLVEPGLEEDPETLDELVPRALPGAIVEEGAEVGVAWEVGGVPGEILEVRLSLEGTDPGLLRRLGQRLRLTEPEDPSVVGWSEQAPEERERFIRTVDLDLAGVEAGTYELSLEVEGPEGGVQRVERGITVVEAG